MTEAEEAAAAAALRGLDEANAKVAANYDYPFTRHLVFGLLMGAVVAAQGAGHLSTMVSCLVIVGVLLVQKWDRKRTGTWIHGFRRGRTRIVTLLTMAVMIALVVPAAHYGHRGVIWVPFALAPLAGIIGIGFSYWWQRIYLAELRAGGRP